VSGKRFPERIPEARLARALVEEAAVVPGGGLRALAKADVHCHALLNAPLSAYEAVLGRSLPRPPVRFRDFSEFGAYLAEHLFPATRTLAGMRALIRAGLERMADEGVVYAEASIDLLLPLHLHVAPEAVIELVAEERERIAPRLRWTPEIGVNRRVAPDKLWPSFLAHLDAGVFGGIDLYDDERAGDLCELARFYDAARERGLLLKAHAGEICGPERVRETIQVLGIDAVQHGVTAAKDPELLALLVDRGTQLNLSLASNIALGVADGYETHAIHELLAAGVNVALGTDDFTLFSVGLCDELRHLRRAGMSVADLAKIRLGAPTPVPSPGVAA
jgi:adenosine deaminase